MRYEFDTEVIEGLPLDKLMAEKSILEELYERLRLLCNRKEGEMLSRVKKTTEKRKATKAHNGWINKKVAERRL